MFTVIVPTDIFNEKQQKYETYHQKLRKIRKFGARTVALLFFFLKEKQNVRTYLSLLFIFCFCSYFFHFLLPRARKYVSSKRLRGQSFRIKNVYFYYYLFFGESMWCLSHCVKFMPFSNKKSILNTTSKYFWFFPLSIFIDIPFYWRKMLLFSLRKVCLLQAFA